MTKACLVDTPIEKTGDDLMNIGLYVESLKEVIESADTPLTIAIQGEWGSGKTSFMNQLREELCTKAESQFFGIWIHSWEYALLTDPNEILLSLMRGIIGEIRDQAGKTIPNNSQFNDYCNKAFNITKKLSKMALCMAAAQMGAGDMAKTLFEKKEEVHSEEVSIRKLKQNLEYAINTSFMHNNKNFIFFIDDLDRLNPVIAVNFLELVKNLFDLEHCIFVLAIDYEVVVRGLKPRFGTKTDKNEREFRSFFDKIIQLPFSVPVSSYDMEQYLEASLHEIGFLSGQDKDLLINLDRGAASIIDSTMPVYDMDLPIRIRAMDVIKMITELSAGGNPRSIKRLVNVLSLLDKIQEKRRLREPEINQTNMSDVENITSKILLYCLVSLQISYPRIYEILSSKPGFYSWDSDFAEDLGCKKLSKQEEKRLKEREEFNEDFERAIYQLCQNDFYLRSRSRDISSLFNIIRALILSSNHEKLFGTNTIEDIEYLRGYDFTDIFNIGTTDIDENRGELDNVSTSKDSTLGVDFPEKSNENYDEENSSDEGWVIEYLVDRAIEKAISTILRISSTTRIDSSSGINTSYVRDVQEKRKYSKKELMQDYDFFSEFEEKYGKEHNMIKWFDEIKNALEGHFGKDRLKYEFKKGNSQINIRPKERRKSEGKKWNLLTLTPLQNKNYRMKVVADHTSWEFRDSDSIAVILNDMAKLKEHFNAISVIPLSE